ncbi:MAG: hypothetical protein HY847_18990 [Betaproteobacteria bacterium]|nr:hypothetical protein [Betaproteobacteria bacterium]
MTRSNHIVTFDYEDARILQRNDGFYYQDKKTEEEFGPFASLDKAVAHMENASISEADLEAEDDLKEIEEELGIADWIDPDTGDLAEESIPHIEDH